jgi:hypothetical protein
MIKVNIAIRVFLRAACASLALAALLLAAPTAHAGTAPITGPDNYEPDDDPTLARWAPYFDEGASFFRPIHRHNFDRSGDVDWVTFNIPNATFAFVRTTSLFGKANTHLSVYRYYPPGEPLPEEFVPQECFEAVLPGPNGGKLVAIACNDNFNDQRRSEVSFDVDEASIGQYFARIQYSAVLPDPDKDDKDDKGEGEGEAPDEGSGTTYSFEASYFGVIPGTLIASVTDDISGDPITTAIVRLQPLPMVVTDNLSGVYILGALSQDTYTINVEAPGYISDSKSQFVSGGGLINVNFPLELAPARHSADYLNPANSVSLGELLRLIQFYNTGQYHCDPNGEDNFGPGSGSHGCPFHDSDYNPGNWIVSLPEILRAIQFYNSGGYHPCVEGEDGFCPGP